MEKTNRLSATGLDSERRLPLLGIDEPAFLGDEAVGVELKQNGRLGALGNFLALPLDDVGNLVLAEAVTEVGDVEARGQRRSDVIQRCAETLSSLQHVLLSRQNENHVLRIGSGERIPIPLGQITPAPFQAPPGFDRCS